MSEINFRLCTFADKAQIIAFMDENWGSKHPIIHCEDYFLYYYVSAKKDATYKTTASTESIQFAVAEESDEIVAVVGYILTTKTPPCDIWVSLWCAKKGHNGVGLELMSKLPQMTGARLMACNNIRPKTMPFYTFLGYTAARIPHYYRLADKQEYSIAKITDKTILPAVGSGELELIPDKETLNKKYTADDTLKPHKDIWHITRRYFEYPRKKYSVYGVKASADSTEKYDGLLVISTVPTNGTNVLRIVDFIGKTSVFKTLGTAINKLMLNLDAEYADCYCYGIEKEVFSDIGFNERGEECENIIPNYLTPPLYENTEYYFFVTDSEDFKMFKADGDQDRPNIEV